LIGGPIAVFGTEHSKPQAVVKEASGDVGDLFEGRPLSLAQLIELCLATLNELIVAI
jgi:hypothetical protein